MARLSNPQVPPHRQCHEVLVQAQISDLQKFQSFRKASLSRRWQVDEKRATRAHDSGTARGFGTSTRRRLCVKVDRVSLPGLRGPILHSSWKPYEPFGLCACSGGLSVRRSPQNDVFSLASREPQQRSAQLLGPSAVPADLNSLPGKRISEPADRSGMRLQFDMFG